VELQISVPKCLVDITLDGEVVYVQNLRKERGEVALVRGLEIVGVVATF